MVSFKYLTSRWIFFVEHPSWGFFAFLPRKPFVGWFSERVFRFFSEPNLLTLESHKDRSEIENKSLALGFFSLLSHRWKPFTSSEWDEFPLMSPSCLAVCHSLTSSTHRFAIAASSRSLPSPRWALICHGEIYREGGFGWKFYCRRLIAKFRFSSSSSSFSLWGIPRRLSVN